MRKSIVTALLVLGAASASDARAQDVGLQIGATPAPVVLQDLDGNPVDLGQFIGKKPVLLEFWATWCSLCKALEPRMSAAQKKYGTNVDFIVVAVGVGQTANAVKRHVEKHPLPGRVVFDSEGKAVRAYMAPGTSYVVMLDAKGRVSYTGTGGEQKLDQVLAKVAGD
jgi:thiol-disulfide isomerase/thioredoxin